MSFVVLKGPTRWTPAPDSATWTFRRRRPESASSCSRTGALSVAAAGGSTDGGLRRQPALSSLRATACPMTPPSCKTTTDNTSAAAAVWRLGRTPSSCS
eukprot:8013529-Alexandrium_andersonii.AAC.1